MLGNYKSSNPAFSSYFWGDRNTSEKKMSILGVFLKSTFCLLLTCATTAFIWNLYYTGQQIKWYTMGGMIAAIIFSLVLSIRMKWAPILVPLYALAKGLALGGFSVYIHQQYPNYPFQAVAISLIAFLVMLLLYKTKIIVLTKKLRSFILASTLTIFTVYLITWILSFFNINVSFIWGDNWFAFGFNVFAVLTATFSLLLDIEYIDTKRNKAPKSNEWIATWGLLVTLLWLYVEVLRLMRRLAIKN